MSAVVIQFPRPGQPLSMNDRGHWRAKANRTRDWRTTTAVFAGFVGARSLPPSTVQVTIPFLRGGRRDPHNYFATVKPIIDGLVDAGLWPDDTPEWVTTVEPELVVDPEMVVTVTITSRSDDA
jgi:crossover junction endodeoxyribonuclease RusA